MAVLAGTKLTSMMDDFYNHIYILPPVLDFDVINKDRSEFIRVWNSHFTPQTMNGMFTQTINDDSVSIEAIPEDYPFYVTPSRLPYEILALKSTPVKINATRGGDTVVEGHILFTFLGGEQKRMEVQGVRGILWPFACNWSGGYTQQWEYKTEIITARSGREQRIATRTKPRKTVEYTSHITGKQRQYMTHLLDNFQHVAFLVPDYPRFVRTLDPIVEAAGSSVALESIPNWMAEGDLVVVVSGSVHERRRILTINNATNTITFKDAGSRGFQEGVKICFALVGNLAQAFQTKRITNDVAEVSFSFETVPGLERAEDPGIPTWTLGDGVTDNVREILQVKPNWSDGLDVTFERESEIIDYNSGTVTRFNPILFGSRVMKATFTNRDYATANYIQQVFNRLKGQRGEIYIPTWENDITVAEDVGSGRTYLKVAGAEFYEMYKDTKTMAAIMVRLLDGQQFARFLYSIEKVSDGYGGFNTYLYMNDRITYDYAPMAQVAMICWMPVFRLASDILTIEWLTDTKSQMQIAFRSVESLAAE